MPLFLQALTCYLSRLTLQEMYRNANKTQGDWPVFYLERPGILYIRSTLLTVGLSELFLLLEERGKADDCSVDQQTSNDRHDHRLW